MASGSASQHSLEETQGSTIDQPSLWDNMTKLENFLDHEVVGNLSVTFAVKADKDHILELEHICLVSKKKLESQAKEVELPCEAGDGFKKRKGISTPIKRAFGVEIRDQLDQEIARMFYTGDLPFNLARNPHYLRAFQFAANNKINGYVPPDYNKLRTLLQKEKDNVHKLLDPLRSTWKEKGVTIVSDG
ncbi:hypothetical protein OSB04_005764 [Centaurea solstitialis]|uniref:DUF659 domain-containing protein n=1 Tax=Centaurea solstitialis TaxID=347529 RepID=A0AA38TIE6_9ASTR|nr:hypothetical protein OSB04_005764 [Centaurea solstitialis]